MNTEHKKDQDALEELLIFAGRREDVEPHRSERVERHVLNHWQGMLQRRRQAERRRRTIKLGGFLALAASLVLTVNLYVRYQGESPVVATLVTVTGDIELGFGDQPLQDSDRNGIELREAGARVLEPLHPIHDLARVGDRRQAGVEMRDRRPVEIRLESVATA